MIEKICLIWLVTLVFFFKTLSYNYVSDDLASFHQRLNFRNKWEKWFLQIRGSLKINKQEDHLITIIIHGLVCMFIYLAFGATKPAFLAALLFCVNPMNNQGSVWMSGRGYVFAALFNLMALTIPVLAPGFMYISTYYNLGYVAPIILFGSKIWWIAAFMPLIWWVRFKKFKNDINNKVTGEMFDEDKKIHWRKLVLVTKTFGFYLSHCLVPFKNTFYHSFLQSASGSGKQKAYTMKDRFFWIGLAALSGTVWYWSTHRWDTMSFALFWWCVGIAPFCNFIRMSQEIAERYVYLANVGLMIALSLVISNNPVAFAAFLAMYATKMWFYMDAYQDDFFIGEFSCLNSPDSWFAWHWKALKRWEVGSNREALTLWVMAKNISPKEFKILFNIATMLKVGRNDKEAQEYFDLALQNIPAGQEKQAQEIADNWKKGKYAVLL